MRLLSNSPQNGALGLFSWLHCGRPRALCGLACLFLFTSLAIAEPPPSLLNFLRAAAEELANNEPRNFCDNFDSSMPGYATLRDEIEALLAAHEVASTIEVVSSNGDDRKQVLELDWLLSVSDRGDRRRIVKVRIERQGKQWKITSFDPIELFNYE